MHEHGAFGKVELDKAEQYYSKAAQAGNSDAQANLGKLYYAQHKDDLAFQYFAEAAKANNIVAQYYLGEMYNEGTIVPRSCPNTVHARTHLSRLRGVVFQNGG
jgi:TPR repeat protein